MKPALLGQMGVRELRGMEDRLDERRGMKKLEWCALPEGMTLETKRPRQMPVDGLLVWCFVLMYTAPDEKRFWHRQRYEATVPEEFQMQWALKDFGADLSEEGYDIPDLARYLVNEGREHGGRHRAYGYEGYRHGGADVARSRRTTPWVH